MIELVCARTGRRDIQGQHMLILKVIQGPEKGKRFECPEWEPQLIGRSSEALRLGDQTCSRRHAEVTPDAGEWFIRDLGSANGTYVNGTRIGPERVRLHVGDQIRAGSTVLLVGNQKFSRRTSPVREVRAELIDAIVEQRVQSNEESMIMAVPDPLAAASEHLRVIYELTRITTNVLDSDALLELVMDLVFEEFQPERGFILLSESEGARPEPVVVRYRTPPRSNDEGRIHVSRTIISHVISSSEGILSSNAMKDRRFSAGDSIQNYHIRSAICVPVKHRDRIYGVLHIDSSIANYTFSESQLRLMTAIGQHTGLALANLGLYQQHLQSERLAAVGETVASLSHSIKNIIQGLRGGADVVGMALKKQDLQLAQGGWDILSRNLDRIYALTLNMLAYSKQRRVEIELMKLGPVLNDLVQLVQPTCDRRGVALITDYDTDMPPIPLDPNTMHQAIMNLLTNALEAVEPNRGVITLQASYDEINACVHIRVSDNGPGIPLAEQPKVWLPFHTTKGLRGTGLGLAVSKKIVEEHHGEISFQSGEGRGTTFSIKLLTDTAKVVDPSETMAPHTGPTGNGQSSMSPQGLGMPDRPKRSQQDRGYSPYDLV